MKRQTIENNKEVIIERKSTRIFTTRED